jgi:adenylate kinase
MFNLILFGPPGSGKGTQSERLVQKYKLKHISTGELLRYEMQHNTELGKEARQYIDKGQLVPDEVVIGMISATLDAHPEVNGCLFDGFPRTLSQAIELDKLLDVKDSGVHLMLALEVSEEELVKRLLKRGETSGRSDDTDASIIRARIIEYEMKTAIVAEHYRQLNKAVSVNGEGSVDEIFSHICKAIDSKLAEITVKSVS